MKHDGMRLTKCINLTESITELSSGQSMLRNMFSELGTIFIKFASSLFIVFHHGILEILDLDFFVLKWDPGDPGSQILILS